MLMSTPAVKDTVKQDLELNSKHKYTEKKFLNISRVKNLSISSHLTSALDTEVEGRVL